MTPPTSAPRRALRALVATAAVALVAGVLAVPGGAAAAGGTAPELTVPRAATTAVSVGAQFHGTWAELSDDDRGRILDTLKASGATWVRIDISWSMIQPKARGQYDLAWGVPLVDKVVRMAADRGLKVLGTFWLTPGWANGGADKRALPTSVGDYAAALQWLAARHRNTVQAWEIWNEPNAAEFLNPVDAVAYTKLLKAAYPAVKAGSPGATVVTGGAMFVDTDWVAQLYAAGAKGSYDVLAVHPYQGKADEEPEDVNASAGRARMTNTANLLSLMKAHGEANVPVWFTEFGWSTHVNTASTPVWYLGVTEQTQADYLTRSLTMIQARYPQVTAVFWYTSRDLVVDGAYHQNGRGLIRRDFTGKPALRALACYVNGCASAAPASAAPKPSPTPTPSPMVAVSPSATSKVTAKPMPKVTVKPVPKVTAKPVRKVTLKPPARGKVKAAPKPKAKH